MKLFRNPLFQRLVPRVPRIYNVPHESAVVPVVPPKRKSWHRSVKRNDRQHIIDELANLFPHIDDGDARTDHAKNLEGFIYEAANSKQEYEMLLSLFQKANEEQQEESSFFDFLSSCSTHDDSDDSDDPHPGIVLFGFSRNLQEENSFSSDHDSNHYGGSESDD